MKHSSGLTKILLACGMLAGPTYIIIGLAQIMTRTGFDMTRHPLSMLSLGDLGWIQITNFLLTGSLIFLGAVGLRRIARDDTRWLRGALCISLFGIGVIGGGLFSTDPSLGFPPGTPDTAPTTMTWHALLHFIFGQLGFLALIVASFIFARYFATDKRRSWMIYSISVGTFFLIAIAASAAVQGAAWSMVALYLAIALAFTWLTTLMAYCLKRKV